MNSARRYPSMDLDEWVYLKGELLREELSKYTGTFGENALDSAFQAVILEHLFLEDLVEQITCWKEDFVNYLMDEAARVELEFKQGNRNSESARARLLLLRNVMDWF